MSADKVSAARALLVRALQLVANADITPEGMADVMDQLVQQCPAPTMKSFLEAVQVAAVGVAEEVTGAASAAQLYAGLKSGSAAPVTTVGLSMSAPLTATSTAGKVSFNRYYAAVLRGIAVGGKSKNIQSIAPATMDLVQKLKGIGFVFGDADVDSLSVKYSNSGRPLGKDETEAGVLEKALAALQEMSERSVETAFQAGRKAVKEILEKKGGYTGDLAKSDADTSDEEKKEENKKREAPEGDAGKAGKRAKVAKAAKPKQKNK